MKLLLDPHAVVWSVEEPANLSATARTAVKDPTNDRMVSAATIWELAIKDRVGEDHAIASLSALDGKSDYGKPK